MDSFVYFKILKNGFDKYPDITYRLSVTGESMLPTLKNGQRITIASKKDISIGDIILFCKFNDHFTLHRVAYRFDMPLNLNMEEYLSFSKAIVDLL